GEEVDDGAGADVRAYAEDAFFVAVAVLQLDDAAEADAGVNVGDVLVVGVGIGIIAAGAQAVVAAEALEGGADVDRHAGVVDVEEVAGADVLGGVHASGGNHCATQYIDAVVEAVVGGEAGDGQEAQ